MTITPVERRRLSDAVVAQLSELITSGAYAVGDKLPSERELARSLAVSRSLVRESFRMLESLGLVEVKPGIGAIVLQSSPASLDIAQFLLNNPAQVLEVIEVRDVIAARAGELAAGRIEDQELLRLADLYQAQIDAARRGNVEELVQLDKEFHSLILQAARNNVLIAMEEYSRGVLNNLQWNALTLLTRQAKSLAEHEQILRALQERDPAAAEQAARLHAQQSNSEIRRLVEQRLAE
jgi:GntR family transcriptional repressor for pyruvate dehydrogenase complex